MDELDRPEHSYHWHRLRYRTRPYSHLQRCEAYQGTVSQGREAPMGHTFSVGAKYYVSFRVS